MFGFFSVMLISHLCLMTIVFPYMINSQEQWLKSVVTGSLIAWALFASIV